MRHGVDSTWLKVGIKMARATNGKEYITKQGKSSSQNLDERDVKDLGNMGDVHSGKASLSSE